MRITPPPPGGKVLGVWFGFLPLWGPTAFPRDGCCRGGSRFLASVLGTENCVMEKSLCGCKSVCPWVCETVHALPFFDKYNENLTATATNISHSPPTTKWEKGGTTALRFTIARCRGRLCCALYNLGSDVCGAQIQLQHDMGISISHNGMKGSFGGYLKTLFSREPPPSPPTRSRGSAVTARDARPGGPEFEYYRHTAVPGTWVFHGDPASRKARLTGCWCLGIALAVLPRPLPLPLLDTVHQSNPCASPMPITPAHGFRTLGGIVRVTCPLHPVWPLDVG